MNAAELPLERINPNTVLALIERAPLRLIDLAQTRAPNSTRRKRVTAVLRTLRERGLVRLIYLEGVQMHVTTGWSLSDEHLQLIIDGRMRLRDGCLEWCGNRSSSGAPIVRVHKAYNRPDLPAYVHVRRWLWQQKKGRVLQQKHTLQPERCGNELCVHPDHMVRRDSSLATRGRTLSAVHRINLMRAVRGSKATRLTPEQVEHIRTSGEPSAALAARYGVSRQNINHVRSGHTWRDINNPFFQLVA